VPKANTLGPAPGEEQGFVFQADGSVGKWWVSGEDVGATTATGSAGASTPHAVRELFTKPAPHVPQSAPLNVESSEEDEDEDEMDERWDLFLETAAEGGDAKAGMTGTTRHAKQETTRVWKGPHCWRFRRVPRATKVLRYLKEFR